MADVVKNRTPTETLIESLETFGEDEPLEVIVIFTTKGGDLCWNCSSSLFSHKLGMLESAKFHMMEAMREA